MAAFIGQAQIGDFKNPGRGGRRTAGLVVLATRISSRAPASLPCRSSGAETPPRPCSSPRRRERVASRPGAGRQTSARSLWEVRKGLRPATAVLSSAKTPVPVGRGLLHRQGQGQEERRHPDAFKPQVVDVLGPDVQQLPAVPFDDALGAHEFHLGRPVGHEKGFDRLVVGLFPHPQGFGQADEIAGGVPETRPAGSGPLRPQGDALPIDLDPGQQPQIAPEASQPTAAG